MEELLKRLEWLREVSDYNDIGNDFAYSDGSHDYYEREIAKLEKQIEEMSNGK
jgi:hypothetical protein